MEKQLNSFWEEAGSWYDRVVGEKGHYYHQQVILPNLLKLMQLESHPAPTVVDLGCGQGILARQIPAQVPYLGIDQAHSLIRSAKMRNKNRLHRFLVADLNVSIELSKKTYSHALFILSLQNIQKPETALRHAAHLLQPSGKLFIVLNHPCFRIPRQSSWGVDEAKQIQFRRIDRYLSPLKIPIQTHPGIESSTTKTWSFHCSLSAYSQYLYQAGFVIELMEEWCSNKRSSGSKAKMENFSRREFPLFLALVGRKAECFKP